MRKFNPLKENHPLIGDICPVCNNIFELGDETTLVMLWPADEMEAQKAQNNLSYTAEAKPVHWKCSSQQCLE